MRGRFRRERARRRSPPAHPRARRSRDRSRRRHAPSHVGRRDDPLDDRGRHEKALPKAPPRPHAEATERLASHGGEASDASGIGIATAAGSPPHSTTSRRARRARAVALRHRRSSPHCRCRTVATGRRPSNPRDGILLHASAQAGVCGHAAGDDDRWYPERLRHSERRRDQHVDDGFLEARRDVAEQPLRETVRNAPLAAVTPTPCSRRRNSRSAVFSPLKLNSYLLPRIVARGKRIAVGSPARRQLVDHPSRPENRARASSRPCRRPLRPRRRGSRRSGDIVLALRRDRGSCALPTRATPRKETRSGARERSASRWPSRWFTPTNGIPLAKAMPLAADSPTSKDPTKPGPQVTAMPSTSSIAVTALSSAAWITARMLARW